MSDDLKNLKHRIFSEQRVEQILEELGCDKDGIKYEQRETLLVAPHPNGWNKRAIQIRMTPSLTSYIRNEGIEGDIFAVIGFFLYECKSFEDVKAKLYQIKQWTCNTLCYDDFVFSDFEKPKPKVDWNYWLRPIQQSRSKEIEIHKNEILDSSILNEYTPYPWSGWVEDGISPHIQHLFDIGFHIDSERVTIPIHNWDGQLIGIKGRYVGSDKTISDARKYTYLYPCSKSIELFNVHRALPFIHDKKECVIVEAAKTVMLLWSMGIYNAVSIEGDKLSPVQAKLLKSLGIDVDLVFAWDKDKDKVYILSQVKQIKNRRMYYLYDDQNLFEDPKASPADDGYEKWSKLYDNKKTI